MINKDSRDIFLMTKYNDINMSSVMSGFKGFDLLNTICETYSLSSFNVIDLVDIESLKSQVSEFMEFCTFLKRFRRLNSLFQGRLHFIQPSMYKKGAVLAAEDNHFEIDGHAFYTLDDVEKAYDNRAFL